MLKRNLVLLKVKKENGSLIGRIDPEKHWTNFDDAFAWLEASFKADAKYFGLAYGPKDNYPLNASETFVGNDGDNTLFIYEDKGEDELWAVHIGFSEKEIPHARIKLIRQYNDAV